MIQHSLDFASHLKDISFTFHFHSHVIGEFNLKTHSFTRQFQSTPIHIQNKTFATPNNMNRKSLNSDEKRGVERFRRVKDETIEIDERVKDNSFEAKVCVLFFFIH